MLLRPKLTDDTEQFANVFFSHSAKDRSLTSRGYLSSLHPHSGSGPMRAVVGEGSLEQVWRA